MRAYTNTRMGSQVRAGHTVENLDSKKILPRGCSGSGGTGAVGAGTSGSTATRSVAEKGEEEDKET